MKKFKTVKLLIALLLMCILVSSCCCLQKPGCFSCAHKKQSSCYKDKGSKCPFASCFMKAPCCALKNKENLSLTTEQETKIKDLCTKTRKDFIQLKANAETIEVDIKTKLMEDYNLDTKALNSLIDKKFELKKQMVKSLINSHVTLLSLLTPEQKEKFKEVMNECKKGNCNCKGSCKSCDDCSDCSDCSECSDSAN